jgi:hypothetical protein
MQWAFKKGADTLLFNKSGFSPSKKDVFVGLFCVVAPVVTKSEKI